MYTIVMKINNTSRLAFTLQIKNDSNNKHKQLGQHCHRILTKFDNSRLGLKAKTEMRCWCLRSLLFALLFLWQVKGLCGDMHGVFALD